MEELKNDIKIEMRDNKVRPDRIYGFMMRILELLSLRSPQAPEPVVEEPVPVPEPEPVAEEPEPVPELEPVPEPEPVVEEPVPAPELEPVVEEPVSVPEPEPVAEEELAESEDADEPEPSAEGGEETPKKSKKSRRQSPRDA